jgi:predicted transcriptional regulator YdeE
MKIIGMANKTTNDNEKSAADMPQFWNSYLAKNVEKSIPHKQEPLKRICLYTDYSPEGYSVIIGACVAELDKIPEALVGREVPAGKYAVFTITGPLETAVLKAWKHVWSIADLPRAYTHDFELYEYDGDTQRDAKIYISLI